MLILLYLLLTASAFEQHGSGHGCRFYQSAKLPDRVAVMKAECEWSDVEFDILHGLLHDIESYEDYFDIIRSSDILQSVDKVVLVHQVQKVRGLKVREILQWMTKEDFGGDSSRFSWNTAHEVPFEVSKGHVRAVCNDGSWLIERLDDGTVRATYELAYDPGGSIPSWVVSRLQLRTFRRTVVQLHDLAAGHSIQSRPARP